MDWQEDVCYLVQYTCAFTVVFHKIYSYTHTHLPTHTNTQTLKLCHNFLGIVEKTTFLVAIFPKTERKANRGLTLLSLTTNSQIIIMGVYKYSRKYVIVCIGEFSRGSFHSLRAIILKNFTSFFFNNEHKISPIHFDYTNKLFQSCDHTHTQTHHHTHHRLHVQVAYGIHITASLIENCCL